MIPADPSNATAFACGRATLSICIITNAPAALIDTVFAPFREVADAFVIVFDDRVSPATQRAYEQLATRCEPVTFAHLERHLALAHDLCTTDWVLRIDTDEVPSAALVARIPELLADPHIQEYRIARRWLLGSATTWLDEVPWAPDHQLRLVRRTETLRFSGDLHTSADGREPAGYVEEPLYHLDCLVNGLSERRLKALRYEVLRPELSAAGGGPMWSYYQPEDVARRPLAAVPADDVPAIERALSASGTTPPTPGRSGAPAAPERLADGIEWLERDRRVQRGATRPVVLRIENATATRWAGWDEPDRTVVRLRWGGHEDEWSDPFIRPLEPGQSRIFAPVVPAPEALGTASLEITVTTLAGRPLSATASVEMRVEDPPPLPTSREVRPARQRGRRWRRGVAATVPQIIHRVWLGDSEMPDAHRRYGDSWQEHHPDWTVRLWTDADAPRPTGVERARNVAERSDLVRYEIVRQHGGIYVDTDVECLRPIDELLDGVLAFAAYEVPGRLCNAVIGAVPGHAAFASVVQAAATTVGTGVYPLATATVFLTRMLEPFPDVTLFGAHRFYPYLWDQDDPQRPGYGDAYAVHHWAKSWAPETVTQ